MNSAAKDSSGINLGQRPSQAKASHAKPILRPSPGAWNITVWLASIAYPSSCTLRFCAPHPGRKPLGGEHLLDRRPWPDNRKSRAIDHHFRRKRPAVVGRGHYRTIGTSGAYHDEVARSQRRQITVLCQKVARLADGTDNVTADRGRMWAPSRRYDL